MGVEYRKDRNRWGFQIFLHGSRQRRFSWKTKDEAERAFRQAKAEAEKIASLPPTALIEVSKAYLLWMHEKRSKLRYKHVRYNLRKWIIPYFGAETPVTRITSDQIEDFMAEHKQRVSAMTVWHYIKDLTALLNWCIKNRLLHENPMKFVDRSDFRYRVRPKLPLNPEHVERGAEALEGVERAYYDFLRFTGARREEGNRPEWKHVDFNHGMVLIPGSKTPGAEDVRPIPQQLVDRLRELPRTSQYVFPSLGNRNVGKKAHSRRYMFTKVSKHVGVKVMPKTLRDYFGTKVVSLTNDPRKIMELMRHTSLRTTTIYMRSGQDDLRQIVENVAVDSQKRGNPSDKSV